MEPPNRYLALVPARTPIPARAFVRASPFVALGVAVGLAFTGLFASGVAALVLAGALVVAMGGTAGWMAFTRARAVRQILAASDAVISESFDDAHERIRSVLRLHIDDILRGETLALLGRTASMRGDLADAADLYHRAITVLSKRRLVNNLDAIHLVSQLRAQRAFALVATGDLEGARAILDAPMQAHAHPAAGALVVRARAFLQWRLGERDAVLALLAANRPTVHTFLTVRDRTFLHVLEARARDVQSEARVPVDADVAHWIERVAPDLAPAMVTG